MMITVNNTVLHVEKVVRVNLKTSSQEKKMCNYVWWHMLTSCSRHFAIYPSIESLCHVTETSLGQLYLNKIFLKIK